MTNFSNTDVLGKRVKNLGKRKTVVMKKLIVMFGCGLLVVVSVLGQSVRIYPSSGPHRLSPSASVYDLNVISALRASQSVSGDWTADPSGYAVFTSLKPTDFRSVSTAWAVNLWRGQFAPTGLFAGEKGNSIQYSLVVESPAKFSLSGGSFIGSSGDALNILARAVSFATRNYSSTWVGIDFGPDGEEGGGDDTVYQSGELGTLLVNKIYAVGEWQTLSSSSQSSWNNNFAYNIPWLKGVYSFAGGTIVGEINIPVADDYGLDFGDVPDSFRTLLTTDGARHTVMPGICFGRYVDPETDGIPSVNANGDDVAGVVPDDEDGWSFPNVYRGQTVTFTNWVTDFTGVAKVWGWVDWNGDGNFLDSGENILLGVNPSNHNGQNIFSVNVPAGAFLGKVGARFRITTDDEITFDGPALNGEVEDYVLEVKNPPPTVVTVIFFVADCFGDKVKIEWGSGFEYDVLAFFVERLRPNFGNWEDVACGTIPAIGSGGVAKRYTIFDEVGCLFGTKYRLYKIDLTGEIGLVAETELEQPTTLSITHLVRIDVFGSPNTPTTIEGSGDLVYWTPVANLTLGETGKGSVSLPVSGNQKYFRVARP